MQHRKWQNKHTGVWYVLFGPRLRQKESLRTKVEKVANQRLEQWLIEMSRPENPDVGAILDGYEDSRRNSRKVLRSPNALKYSVKALKPALGHLKPQHLIRRVIEKYADDRNAEGIADGTILRDVGVLRAALEWAASNGVLPKSEILEIKNPRDVPKGRQRWLTRAEADALLKQCREPHLKLFVTLGLMTGARHTAILELTWDRINFETGLVDFGDGHGNKHRAIVPMNRDLREVLVAAKTMGCSDYVVEFIGKRIGTVKNAFAKAAGRAKLHDEAGNIVTPHHLRHTCATWLVMARVPYEEIGLMLGDNPETIRRIYGHHHPDFLGDAARALESNREAA